MAYHFEPSKIAILGVDAYGYGHWYDRNAPYNAEWKDKFTDYLNRLPGIYNASVNQLKEKGIKVVLGSPKSKIECFEKTIPEQALKFIKD